MDVDKLLKALDNEDNASICNMTTKKLQEIKIDVLRELELPRSMIVDYIKKLKCYRYIEEVNELKYGAFIRWINITDPENIGLTSGGLICDIRVTDDGMALVCKNFAHKHYEIKVDECQIFQKLTGQEQVLLSALDHLAK